MRVIWLIALREYIENVRSRGFWIGVLLIPVIFAGIFLFSARLADNVPVRHYILIDQSGQYEEAVASAIRPAPSRPLPGTSSSTAALMRSCRPYRPTRPVRRSTVS